MMDSASAATSDDRRVNRNLDFAVGLAAPSAPSHHHTVSTVVLGADLLVVISPNAVFRFEAYR